MTFWSAVKVYMLCAFLLLTTALVIANAAWPVTPKEFPGHRNDEANYEGLPDFDARWTWYDTVAAHDFCNMVPLDELHPESLKFLYMWHRGLIDDEQFYAAFGLPNSDYITAGSCIVAMKASFYLRVWEPHA